MALACSRGPAPAAQPHSELPDPSEASSAAPATREVFVRSSPEGAAIWVDGEDSSQLTPAHVPMTLGAHTVNLKLAGRAEQSVPVYVPSDDIPKPVDAALTFDLTVTSNPSNASAALDDGPERRTPATFPLREPGTYRLRVRLQGYVTERREVQLAAAGDRAVHVELADGAELTVTSTPPDAAIFLDGKPTGERTPTALSLPVRRAHLLRLEKPGFDPLVRKVLPLKKGEARTLELFLANKRLNALREQMHSAEAALDSLQKRLEALRAEKKNQTGTGSVEQAKATQKQIDAVEASVERATERLTALHEQLQKLE